MTDYSKEDPQTIKCLFNKIAPQYDRANALMSFNLHKKWNRTLSQMILSKGDPSKYLDLCSGTGEIAFTTLKDMKLPSEAFLLDFSDKMLDCAKNKELTIDPNKHRIHYLHADAQAIPLPENSIDAITIAYGIRNVQNPARCIEEAHRVLKNGGIFAILELTRPTHSIMKMGHKIYTKFLLPIIGRYVASDAQAYNYLQRSIQSFIQPMVLENLLKHAGFKQTLVRPLSGGIATIISGHKS